MNLYLKKIISICCIFFCGLVITGKCSAMYEELNLQCKNIAQFVAFENSVLGDKMLKSKERDFLLGNWNAFLIALIADQSVKVEIAWRLPYYLYKRLGHLDFQRILTEQNVDSLEKIIKAKPALHRYPRKMAEYIYSAAFNVVKKYKGDIGLLWETNTDARLVIEELEKLNGISHKKASLGTLLLVRDFGVNLNNLKFIDIAADVHVRRVFSRMGLIEQDTPQAVVKKAQEINPDFPGSLTLPFWVVGRDFCRPLNPDCTQCPLSKFCKKTNEMKTQDIEDMVLE